MVVVVTAAAVVLLVLVVVVVVVVVWQVEACVGCAACALYEECPHVKRTLAPGFGGASARTCMCSAALLCCYIELTSHHETEWCKYVVLAQSKLSR